MKDTRSAGENDFLKLVLAQAGGDLTSVITDAVQKTVESMFGQKIFAVEGRPGEGQPLHYAARVILVQEPSRFTLRLSFDATLLKTLVASVYPLEAANSEEALRDVVAEVSNIVAGHIKTYVNQKGFTLTRDLPVAEFVADGAAAGFNLNFSIFRNSLAVRNLLTVSLL